MEYLNYGTGRVVFKVDDNTVVKIPYNQSGIEQNHQEYEIYNANKDSQIYAECDLDEKGWLYMEYLEDCSVEYYNHSDKIHCSVYDDSTDKTLVFTCKGNCISCEHNIFVAFTDEELMKIETFKTKDRIQVGRAKNGILKFYDYANTTPVDHKFIFDKSYLELFYKYLSENSDELFAEWVQTKELPQAHGNIESSRKLANRFKRKCFNKRVNQM